MNDIQKQIDKILIDDMELEINILDEKSDIVGLLKPITTRHLECNEIIEKITAWRNLSMENFLTQFEATPDRTRAWIKNILLKEKGQMLFLIYSQNQIIGHYGFKELTTDDVLLDNAMRGEEGGDPKLLVNSGKAIVEWLFSKANVTKVRAEVMSENVPSIMLTTRIGFTNRTRHPLKKIIVNDETKWLIGDEGEISALDKYCFNYSISKYDFEHNKNINK
tara:strand:- start:1953 stop:2615 length:663 start_codon:yes stop_codon:yes gene_type:complete